MQNVEQIIHYPLVRLSGGALTLAGIFIGAAVIIASFALAGLASRSVASLLKRRNVALGAQFAAKKMLRYAIVVLGILVAIDSMGLSLSAIFAASAVLLVGIGFGLQNITQNFISGLIVLIEQPVRPGDFIKVGDTYGTVQDIGLRATRVLTRDQVMVIIPNSHLVTSTVINHSSPSPQLRVRIRVGVAYGTDITRASKVLLEVASSHSQVLKEPTAEVRFDNFADSSLELSLLVWIGNARDDLRVASALRFAIDEAFTREGIRIPFPQRDVHLRSGFEALLPASKGR